MVQTKIALTDIADIEKLCAAAVEQTFDIDIVTGNYIIDAKSIMGIFALDRSQPLGLHIHSDDVHAARFLQLIPGLLA